METTARTREALASAANKDRMRRMNDLSLAIDKSNCIRVRVNGTNHLVRTNKLEARGLNQLTGGSIPWRAEAGYLDLG